LGRSQTLQRVFPTSRNYSKALPWYSYSLHPAQASYWK